MSDDKDQKAAKAEEQRLYIEALRSKHGRIGIVDFDDGRFVALRRPKREEYDSWLDMGGPNASQKVRRQLVEDCRVHPSKEELDAILDDYPAALAGACMGAVLDLAGLGKAKARYVG
jgi:hypothetical protein